MDFHHALLAHYGRPRHLAGGGFLGTIGDVLSGSPNTFDPTVPVNTFNPAIINNDFNPTNPAYAPNLVKNNFDPTASVNKFQGVNPQFAQTDLSGALGAGLSGTEQGLGALGNTFGAQQALAAQGAQALGQQQGLYNQQQSLADALLAQSRGEGPNPAQMQLRQDTDRAIAQQATALASQRGINPAIAARMAAHQGAQQNQQMAGQAAVLGAQQQLAAQQALGQQQQALGQNLLGQNATIANQGNLYNQAAGTAGTLGGLGAQLYGTGVQGAQAQNQLLSQNSLATQGINAQTAQQNAALNAQNTGLQTAIAQQNAALAQEQQGLKSGLAQQKLGIQAGVAQQNADLAQQRQGLKAGVAQSNQGAQTAGQQMQAGVAASNAASNAAMTGGILNAFGGYLAKADGGEIPDRKALNLADALMGRGGEVPGKGKVKGDAASNDVVPTVLSPKEIVLPRTVTMAEDAPEKAAEFVAKLKGKSGSGAKGYGKILEKHRELQKRMADLEEIIRSQVG